MNYLYRFEDKYGSLDIMCSVRGVTRDFSSGESIVVLSDNEQAVFDLSISRVFSVNRNTARKYRDAGVDVVVFVFDMDNVSGDSSVIMDLEYFTDGNLQYSAYSAINTLSEFGIKCLFMPILFSAETIGLLQYCKDDLDPCDIIHKEGTAKLHAKLLTNLAINRLDRTKKLSAEGKKFYKFIEGDIVIYKSSLLTDSINKSAYNWFSSRCSIEDKHLLEYSDCLDLLKEMREFYEQRINCNGTDSITFKGIDLKLRGVTLNQVSNTIKSSSSNKDLFSTITIASPDIISNIHY